MIYCPNCGTSLPDGSAFCGVCGTALSQPTDYETPPYDYEAPAYDYAAPACQTVPRTPSAPVWIVAVAMLVGMLFLRFAFNFIWAQIPYPESPVGNVIMNNVRTLLTYGIIFGLSMGGIAVCNSVCRSRGQKELSLPLTDAFIPFGCWVITSLLTNVVPIIPKMTSVIYTIIWLVIALGTAAGAYFLLLAAVNFRQKVLHSQQAYDTYPENQW